MSINYIYNSNGKPEYAVVPYLIWEKFEKEVEQKSIKLSQKKQNKFTPSSYKGILKKLHIIDIDKEISEMRSEWTGNLL